MPQQKFENEPGVCSKICEVTFTARLRLELFVTIELLSSKLAVGKPITTGARLETLKLWALAKNGTAKTQNMYRSFFIFDCGFSVEGEANR